MSPTDAISAGLDGVGSLVDRVDTDRVADLVADLAVADIASSVASSTAALSDQIANAVDQGKTSDRNTRVAVGAGLLVVAVGLVLWVRRRKQLNTETGAGSTLEAA